MSRREVRGNRHEDWLDAVRPHSGASSQLDRGLQRDVAFRTADKRAGTAVRMTGRDDSACVAGGRGRFGRITLAGLLTLGVGSILGVAAQLPAGAATPMPSPSVRRRGRPACSPTDRTRSRCPRRTWRTCPVDQPSSSATRPGYVYSFNLATGAAVWTYNAGAPVNSSPRWPPSPREARSTRVFVGSGDAAIPTAGGYQAISPTGGDQWFVAGDQPAHRPHGAQRRAGLAGRRQPPGRHRRDRGLPGPEPRRPQREQRMPC